jgi:NAD(P)-dependent dehydrogenase (short-subunit alcohol dehydrogenase family)
VSAFLISGASTGIGEASTVLLAEKGHLVFAGVRSEADAVRIASQSASVRPVVLDVTSSDSIERAMNEVDASGAQLDGVVCNAGIALGGPLEHLPIDELRRQFEVNVFGALALAQAYLTRVSDGGGRIVFVGSISGRLATPYIGPYSASKFALRALSDALRIELAPAGVSVSLIEAGSVRTPIWKKGRDRRNTMLERLGPNPRSHYRAALERLFAITEAEERDSMPVDVVTTAIAHALIDRKPRAHYLLGPGARIGSIVAVLPPELRDRAIRKSMKIP